MTHGHNEDEARIKLRDLIEAIRTVMLISTDADGTLQARPMAVLAVEEDTVWFFTDVSSPKALQIGQDREVLLSCANPAAQDYVAVRGTGRIVQDPVKQKALWTEVTRLWFPEGAASPNLALLAVDMIAGEYWDGPSSVARFTCGYVKALVAGKPVDLGENAKVRFSTG